MITWGMIVVKYIKLDLGDKQLKRLDWLKPAHLNSYKLKLSPKSPSFDLLIKHDETCAQDLSLYGASKIRKLAYILPSLMEKSPQALLTVGSEGSHHVLSTCIAAQRLGLPIHVALSKQVHSDHSQKVYEHTRRLAQTVSHFTAQTHQEFAEELALWKQDFEMHNYAFIPTGGSCLFGVFGMVEAMFELVDQLFDHQHRSATSTKRAIPTDIYMATASGSSLAGLLLGLSLAWPSNYPRPTVFGVRVSDQSLVNRQKVLALYHSAAEFMEYNSSLTGTVFSSSKTLTLPSFEILGDFIGEGYAMSTNGAQTALMWGQKHGVNFDLSYTAKAFGALLSRERRLWIKNQRSRQRSKLLLSKEQAKQVSTLKPTQPLTQLSQSDENSLLKNQTAKNKVFLFWHSLDTRKL